MKKRQLVYTLVVILCFNAMSGCKKNRETDPEPQFSFTYKGKTYEGAMFGGVDTEQSFPPAFKGVFINKPELFGGIIIYDFLRECAYLQPTGSTVSNDANYGCSLKASYDQHPIDSIHVFWLKDAKNTYREEQCSKVVKEQINGSTLRYDRCFYSGDFSLTLKNKTDSLIEITGNFSMLPLDKR